MSKTVLTAEAEALAIDKYVADNNVEQVVEDVVAALLRAKPENPRQWLLDKLEHDLSNETDELSESDLHKLFAASRKITSEIVPRDTIDMVISETMQILNCAIVSLFVLERKSGMLLLYASNLETPIKVSPGQGIAGSVFNTQKTVNIPDCYKDARFDQSFDKKSGYVTKSLIAVPIVDYEGVSVGVIQAINKLSADAKGDAAQPRLSDRTIPFGRNDEKILLHLTQHVAIAMRNADVYREAIMASERSTGLLNTIQSLSQDLGTQSLLLTITMHANKIVSAQRSTVFLVDEPHQQLWSVSTDTGQEIRIPKTAGIAGQCCTDGVVINIPDAYADKRFNQSVDKKTGFKTHSILAVPMLDDGQDPGLNTAHTKSETRASIGSLRLFPPPNLGGKQVIGVIQMINKVSYDGQLEAFDESDVEIMEMFSKFVAPSLRYSAMLAKRDSSVPAEAELALTHSIDSLKGAQELHTPSRGARKRLSEQPMLAGFAEEAQAETEAEEDTS